MGEFKEQFGYALSDDPEETLAEIVLRELGHQADEEESIHAGPYDMIVKEVSLRGIKSIQVRTRR